jgi:FtsH-binding integral membrane protein
MATYVQPKSTTPASKDSIDIEQPNEEDYTTHRIPTGRHPQLRNAFLRRVYGILSVQLIVTLGVAMLCMFSEPVRLFSVAHTQAVVWGTFIPTLAILIALAFLKNKHPWNTVLLCCFTVLESWVIGVICAIYHSQGIGIIVAEAAGLTLAVFLSLTAYCLISKRDFSFLGGFLFAGLFLLMGWGLLNMLFGWHTTWLYSLLGAVLFCGYILFDTYQISQKYEVDDYIIASIDLYLDIINLFLFILQLLYSRNDQ